MSLRNPKAAAATDDASTQDTDRHRCMLLADSSPQCVPQHVHRLLHGHFAPTPIAAAPLRQAEICFVLAYAVALESGYAAAEHAAHVPLQRLRAVSSFHGGNVAELAGQPPAYTVDATRTIFECRLENLSDGGQETDATAALATRLNGLVVGEDMILSLTAGRPCETPGLVGRSSCLPMSRYVLNMRLSAEKPLHQLFRHMDEFALRLRQELFVPMHKQQVQLLCGPCLYPALDGLPAELYPEILRHLSPNEVYKLANVCRTLNACCVKWSKQKAKQRLGEVKQ